MIDTAAIRSHFPALERQHRGRPVLFFDNPAGTQVPRETIQGFAHYLEHSNANTGGEFVTSQETGRVVSDARSAMADLLGASSPDEIVFGQNMTSLTFHLSHALGAMLQPGDEIVTTRLEHDANIAPWLALQDRGVVVKWIDIHPEDATLDLESAQQVIGPRTRLLAIGLASNAFGTVNPVRRLADMAHAHGAWVFVDAVHYVPHGPVDVAALGCDLLTCSSYKFFGPHLGILWGRYEVLSALPSQHVRPAGDDPPDSWETGTQNHEALSGLLGTLSYLCSLGEGESRRAKLVDAMQRINAYERSLTEPLISGLRDLRGCTVFGITEPGRFDQRVPTASFRLEGVSPGEGARRLAERGIFSWAGNHYALEPMGRLRIDATQRIGLAHYNTREEVELFLNALCEVAGG